jgi:fructose-bisphosphate aldolase class I
MMNATMAQQMAEKDGFIAALDQSGGSTPKGAETLRRGGNAYSNDEEMFALIHAMRARIIKSPAFTGEKVIGAILFERTMDGEIDGIPTADYLWDKRGIVPFLKVDKGLMDEENGVQLMKPMNDLDALLERAVAKNVFGTKMRSVINAANKERDRGHRRPAIRNRQADPRPRADADHRAGSQHQDRRQGRSRRAAAGRDPPHLDTVPKGQQVMLKLSLPTKTNLYKPLVDDPRVMRVVALSGGYSRDEANRLLSANSGVIASFSRALTEGLSHGQSDADFDATLAATIDSIFEASRAGLTAMICGPPCLNRPGEHGVVSF